MYRLLLYILLVCMPAISFSQDILVKRDSSKIEAKVLEIRPNEIKYKYFNYQDGPVLVIHRNEIAYIIYPNGQSEYFQFVHETTNASQFVYVDAATRAKQDSIRKASRQLSRYINLSFEAGLVMNESYVNKPYDNSIRLGSLGSPEYEDYNAPGKKNHVNYGYSAGVNFIAGKSPFCKHLIGINYLNSTGEFNYSHTGGVHDNEAQQWIGYDKEAHYKSTVHYINVLTGVRFIICKRLCIDNAVAINIPVRAVNTVNGYEINYKQGYSSYYEERHDYNNEITHDSKVNVTVSFVPKLSYEFKIGKQKLGMYFSYNISRKYNLPWYVAGFTYYPFRKLR